MRFRIDTLDRNETSLCTAVHSLFTVILACSFLFTKGPTGQRISEATATTIAIPLETAKLNFRQIEEDHETSHPVAVVVILKTFLYSNLNELRVTDVNNRKHSMNKA